LYVGYEFIHDKLVDPKWAWRSEEAKKNAPPAVMVVTRINARTVWFAYAGVGVTGWMMKRDEFEAKYGGWD
jgi:hypothetical protein